MIEPNLLFKSSFDDFTVIGDEYNNGGMWAKKISGLDRNSGYDWGNTFPGSLANHFVHGVNIDKVLAEYANTNIEALPGIDIELVNTLHQIVIKNDTASPLVSQSQYAVIAIDDESTNNLKQIYIKYKIKLQDNLVNVLSSRALMTWDNIDYQMGLYITKDDVGTPIWQLQAETVALTSEVDWIEFNNNITVPIGEWFTLEVFWKHSSDVDGRVWVAVNGVDVFYHRGRNKIDHKMGMWSPFSVLGSLELGAQEQWITDVEVWDDIPMPSDKKDNTLLYAALAVGGLIVITSGDNDEEERRREERRREEERKKYNSKYK